MKHSQQFADRLTNSETGFSLIELLIVVALMIIMTLIGVSALVRSRELGVTEDQTIRILELLREARQLAITKRRAVRFEIDAVAGFIRIIDTNGSGMADDILVTSTPFIRAPVSAILDQASPVALPYPTAAVPDNYPEIAFSQPPHPLSEPPGNVWAAVFLNNGMMIDPATAGVTGVPVPLMATIVIQNPVQGNATLRAITLFGGSSSVKMWKYAGAGATACPNGRAPQNFWCN